MVIAGCTCHNSTRRSMFRSSLVSFVRLLVTNRLAKKKKKLLAPKSLAKFQSNRRMLYRHTLKYEKINVIFFLLVVDSFRRLDAVVELVMSRGKAMMLKLERRAGVERI